MTFHPSPDDLLPIKTIAQMLGCSRSYVYILMDNDPEFRPDAYIGRSPRLTRRKAERKRRQLIEATSGKRGPGRPRKTTSAAA